MKIFNNLFRKIEESGRQLWDVNFLYSEKMEHNTGLNKNHLKNKIQWKLQNFQG